MYGFDLRGNAKVALAIAFRANHTYGRGMDKLRISAELAGQPDGLRGAARVAVNQNCVSVGQGELFSD